MFIRVVIIVVIAFMVAQAKHIPKSSEHKIEKKDEVHQSLSPYKYEYAVDDPKTGDYKSHQEESDGENVKGEYTIADPDGTIRTVQYTVGKYTGYQAIITTHSEHDHKIEYYGFPANFHKTVAKSKELNHELLSAASVIDEVNHIPETSKRKVQEKHEEHQSPSSYNYGYAVENSITGDFKSHQEESDGKNVKGEYTVVDPDGTIRTVRYIVGKNTGYQTFITTNGKHNRKVNFYGFPAEFHKTVAEFNESKYEFLNSASNMNLNNYFVSIFINFYLVLIAISSLLMDFL